MTSYRTEELEGFLSRPQHRLTHKSFCMPRMKMISTRVVPRWEQLRYNYGSRTGTYLVHTVYNESLFTDCAHNTEQHVVDGCCTTPTQYKRKSCSVYGYTALYVFMATNQTTCWRQTITVCPIKDAINHKQPLYRFLKEYMPRKQRQTIKCLFVINQIFYGA